MAMKVYVAGDMLNVGSQLQRKMESEELAKLGIEKYVPHENKSINDKQATKGQDDLAERIVKADTEAILEATHVMIEPMPHALGTCVELGQIYQHNLLMNKLWEVLYDSDSELDFAMRVIEIMDKYPVKKVYPHMQDIRRHDEPRVGDRREWGCNAYVYGTVLDLTDGKGFYEYPEIYQELEDEKKYYEYTDLDEENCEE